MKKTNYKAMTLVELLVAMVVAGIVLAAVATLAYAVTSANSATGDRAQKQARLRYATLRTTQLVKHCKMVCGTPDGDLALWLSDDNDDNKINVNELVIIQKGGDNNYLRLCEFPSDDDTALTLDQAQAINPSEYPCSYIQLIPQCNNVLFSVDAQPPYTEFVSFSFDIIENEAARHYQINATLRAGAAFLVNESGQLVSSDDD